MPPYAIPSLLYCLLAFLAGVLVARQIFERKHLAERARLEEEMLRKVRARLEAYEELESQVMRIFERLNEIESETAQGLALSDERLRNLNNALSAIEGKPIDAGGQSEDALESPSWMSAYLEGGPLSVEPGSGIPKVVPVELLVAQKAESAAHEKSSIAQWQDRFEAMRQEKHAEIERQGVLITQLTERLSKLEPRADITKRLEVEMVTWQNKYQDLQNETAVEIAGLRAKVRNKDLSAGKLPELESRIAQLEAASEQLRREKDAVIAELEARAAEYEQNALQEAQRAAGFEELTTDLEAHAATLEARAQEQSALAAEFEERAAEYEARAAQLEPSVSALEAARAEVAEWQQRCEEEIARRELEIAGLRGRVDELEPMENTIEFLWEDKAGLERSLAEKRQELDQAQAQCKQQLGDLNEAREALAVLESNHGELSARTSELEASKASLQESQAHIAELEQTLADERARICALEQELEAQTSLVLERELEVERWIEECEDAGRQCADWEQRLRKFEADKQEEVMSLQSHVELLEPLLERVSSFEQLVVDLEARERGGRARIAQLEADSNRLASELQERTREHGEASGRLEEVERQLNETTALLTRTEEQHARELGELQERLQDHAGHLASARALQTQLECGVQERDRRIQQLEDELSNQKSSFTQLQSEVQQRLRESDEQHSGELAELHDRAEQYGAELAAAQVRQAELGSWNAEQAERVRTLEGELSNLQDSYAQYRCDVKEQQRQTYEQHAGELAELQGRIQHSTGELEAAWARHADLEGQKREQDERVRALEGELSGLQARFAEHQAQTGEQQRQTAEQHAGELAELQGRIQHSTGELEAAWARHADLEGQKHEQDERVRSLEGELSGLQTRFAEYQAQTSEHQLQTAEEHAGELAGLRGRIEQYIDELASARTQQAELGSRSAEQSERVRSLEGELSALRASHAEYQSSTEERQRQAAERHAAELADLNGRIQHAGSELDAARARHAEQEGRNHEQAARVRELEGELSELRTTFAEYQSSTDERQRQTAERRETELTELGNRIEWHLGELAGAQSRHVELEGHNQEQADRIRQLEDELSVLRESYAQYQSGADERMRRTTEQHARELAELNGRVQHLSEELATARDQRAELESRNQEQAGRVQVLQDELSAQQVRAATLQAEGDLRREQHAKELVDLQGRIQDYTGALSIAQTKQAELELLKREQDGRVQVLERELSTQRASLAALQAEVDARLRQTDERHAADLNAMQRRLQDYVGELASAQSKLSDLGNQNREKGVRVQALERDLHEQRTRCAQLDVELEALMQDLVGKRAKIDALQGDVQDKTDLVETLMEQLERAAEEGLRVRRDVEKKRELVEAAESVLAELRPKLDALETQLQSEEHRSGAA